MLYDTVKTEYPCEKLNDSHGYFYSLTSLLSSSPRNFNRRLVSFQSFITGKDFNFIS